MIRAAALVAGLAVAAALGSAGTAGTGAAAAVACPPGKVRVSTDGVRSCVAAGRLRQSVVRRTATQAALHEVLAGGPIALRQTTGRRVIRRAVSPALTAAVARAYAAREPQLVTAARAAATRRVQNASVGPTSQNVTLNPDGSATATATFTATSGIESVTLEVALKASRAGALDVSISAAHDDGAGLVTRRGITVRGIEFTPRQTCPTATGAIRFSDGWSATQTSSETYGGARVRLGTIRSATTVAMKVVSSAQMGPDARLGPIAVAVSGSQDFAASGQALAFFSGRSRVVATGALRGAVDPVSGAMPGASLTTNARAPGVADGGVAEAKFRASLQKLMEDEVGRVLGRYRDIEKAARAGECTRLVLRPGSPAALKPGGSERVDARLETAPDGVKVRRVRWAATPVKGSVAPRTSPAAEPTFAVTGAARGPETARIRFRAVSPAGISEGVWVGTAGAFPATYTGTVSYTGPLGGGIVETWNGTVTYTRVSADDNPDGSQDALYQLTAATIASHTGAGICSWSAGPGGAIESGDLEIGVTPAGVWSSAFQMSVSMGSVAFTCPPAPASPGTPKAILNTRGPTGAFRPMAPAGPVSATGATDVGFLGGSTASWNLTPSG